MANRKFLVAESGPDGSPGAPTYTFLNDATSGMYYPGSNGLGFSTNGGARLTIDNAGVVTLTATGRAINSAGFIDITRATAGSGMLRTFVTGDTVERHQIRADGFEFWGPGGSTALDTGLKRESAGVLAIRDAGDTIYKDLKLANLTASNTLTASLLTLQTAVSTNTVIQANVTGDTQQRFTVDGTGKLTWGTGALVADTNLYRSAASVLTTDDQFVAITGLSVGTSVLSADELLHTFKTWSNDDGATKLTNYFQSTLEPTGVAGAGGDLAAGAYAGYFEHNVSDATATGNITGAQIALRAITLAKNNAATPRTLSGIYGIWADTNFSGAGTFGNVSLATGIRVLATTPGSGVWADRRGIHISNAAITAGGAITNQYGLIIDSMTGAGTGNFAIYLAGTLGTPANGITWNGDTNLYRSNASQLKTDDDFWAAGKFSLGGSASDFMQRDTTATWSFRTTTDTYFRVFSTGTNTLFSTTNAFLDLKLNNTTSGAVAMVASIQAGDSGAFRGLVLQPSGSNVGIGIPTTTVPQSRLVLGTTADTTPAAGMLIGDIALYRLSTNILATDSRFHIQRTNGTDIALTIRLAADNNNRLMGLAGGSLNWGDGTNVPDTNLYRSAANFLATDDAFQVLGGQVFIQSSGFGFVNVADTAGGTNTKHFRMMSAGGFTSFQTVNDAYTVATSVLEVNNSTGKLLLGSGRDNANLYRGGANLVETDGSLQVNGNVGFNGKTPAAPDDYTNVSCIPINTVFPASGLGLKFTSGSLFAAGGGGFTFAATGTGFTFGRTFKASDQLNSNNVTVDNLARIVARVIADLQETGVML